MDRLGMTAILVFGLFGLSACASGVPPSRLSQYMGSQAAGELKGLELLPEVPVRAGLVLVADTTAPDAAPAIPDEGLSQMAEALRDQLGNSLRIDIEQTLPT